MKILYWFNRARTNKKQTAPIMMRMTLDGQRLNLSTQIEIQEKQWDINGQRVKGTDELAVKYNQYLANLKAKVWDIYNECLKGDIPVTLQMVRDKLQGKDKETYSLMDAVDYYIDHLKARVGNDISSATVQKYETCKRKLTAYMAHARLGEDVLLQDLNYQFIQEFDLYMRSVQQLHNNGVVKNMQQLRRIMTVAVQNEWINKDPFIKYKCKLAEPKRIFLTAEELKRMEEKVFTNERLQRVRDVFIFSCYTGLAYADVSKLTYEHLHKINKQDWIILNRTKTKNQSTIPLLPKAADLLKIYKGTEGGRLLPVISSQNMNKYLKEVAAAAGVGKRLSFHCARHTFASTVTLNEGVDITTVSAMLGHKMIRTTQIYAKVDLNKIANDTKKLF